MTLASTYRAGAIIPGETHVEIFPKYRPAQPLPGVLHVHGAGGSALTAIQFYDDSDPHATAALAGAGYTSVSPDLGGPQTWGNASITEKITTSVDYLRALPGVKPGRVVLYGQSAGGLGSLNWAGQNADQVAAIVLIVPVVNLTDIKVNNRTGYAGFVDAAYGGNYTEAQYGATRNPMTQALAGKYAGIPMMIHYGLTDTTCVPAETQAFINALDPDLVTAVTYPTGHDMDTYKAVDNQAIVEWIKNSAR